MTELPQQKVYEVQLQDKSGGVLSSKHVEAASGDAAARQVDEIVNGTAKIVVADGKAAFEMGVEFWQKRARKR